MQNEINKIETINTSSGIRLLVTYADGYQTHFGEVKTEKGAINMLTRYAKRFALTKIDPFTAVKG